MSPRLAIRALLAVAAVVRATGAPRTVLPLRWSQGPSRLQVRLTVSGLHELKTPVHATVENDAIVLFSEEAGVDLRLPLLRPVVSRNEDSKNSTAPADQNKATTRVSVTATGVTYHISKRRYEPCWRRLLQDSWVAKFQRQQQGGDKSKKRDKKAKLGDPAFVRRDSGNSEQGGCQLAKEEWREIYFSAKLRGANPSKPRAPGALPRAAQDEGAESRWLDVVAGFRQMSVPRSKKK